MGDGLEWIEKHGAVEGYYLTFAQGMSARDLVVLLGAAPEEAAAPRTTAEMHGLLHEKVPWQDTPPDVATFGECGGWAFALEPPSAWTRGDRLGEQAPRMPEGTRSVTILDTTMDPPQLTYAVDGTAVWQYHEGVTYTYRSGHTEQLDARLVAARVAMPENGEPDWPTSGDEDEHDDDEAGREPRLFRIVAEHFGLRLPTDALLAQELPAVFTEPRLLRIPRYDPAPGPYAPCAHCGGAMRLAAPEWGPGHSLLTCESCEESRAEEAPLREIEEIPNPAYRHLDGIGPDVSNG
ncbi:hypothetical protein [Streptomyces sp. MN13]